MKRCLASALLLVLALSVFAHAQDDANPLASQGPEMESMPPAIGRGAGPGGGGGVAGTVTEVAPDRFTIRTFRGETYTIHYSANTRIVKQQPGQRGASRMGGNPPQPIQAGAIQVGDRIAAMGAIDTGAKSVGAVGVVLLDPERARQMEKLEAGYGKTWLMGRVTAIEGTRLTLLGSLDRQTHTLVADENTRFRKRRVSISLADIGIGDVLRAEGAVQKGVFTATSVNVMPAPGTLARVPRNAPPQ